MIFLLHWDNVLPSLLLLPVRMCYFILYLKKNFFSATLFIRFQILQQYEQWFFFLSYQTLNTCFATECAFTTSLLFSYRSQNSAMPREVFWNPFSTLPLSTLSTNEHAFSKFNLPLMALQETSHCSEERGWVWGDN